MNVQNLRENSHKLIDYLRKEDYAKTYISRIVSEMEWIIDSSDSKHWKSYKDVYYDYTVTISKHTGNLLSKESLRAKRNILGIVEQFDLYGVYPNGKRKPKFIPTNAYSQLCDQYKGLIDYYCVCEKKRGVDNENIQRRTSPTATFLLYLQHIGFYNFTNITERIVLSYFTCENGTLRLSRSCKNDIKTVLKKCVPYNSDCATVLLFLPSIKSGRKNIQYLTFKEVKLIKEALHSDKLTLRDKAIGLLLVHTGLRSCDIANLTLKSIDWDNDIISISQQKTGIPLQLPLTAIVGNAIYDYITEERKNINCDYLFISYNKGCDKLSPRAIPVIINKIMDINQVRIKKGNRRGSHIFRHYNATKLIGNGVSQPIVSAILGHDNPSSINHYLSADFVHLKECALSIEQFPIEKEVFENENF